MSNIFINGLNAKTGGGKSILSNYLFLLKESQLHSRYYVLTSKAEDYIKYENNNIKIVGISKLYQWIFSYPLVYSYLLPKLLKKLEIDTVFNLADIPIKTHIRQVFLFDWSYAIYPDSVVWDMMDYRSYIIRKIKLRYFRLFLKYVDIMIVQTETAKERIENLFDIRDIRLVPNAVSKENLNMKIHKEFNLPSGIKLLYLTHYYPHKNLEFFLPLAEEIRRRNLEFKIITTVNSEHHKLAKKFLGNIEALGLKSIIYNIGTVDMEYVPSLYSQCDGLLMPTLLESFSGAYVEAMYHRLPIFTSDLDFAHDVCKDGAVYFDPFDAKTLIDKLCVVFSDENIKNKLIMNSTQVLSKLPDWQSAFSMFNRILDNLG